MTIPSTNYTIITIAIGATMSDLNKKFSKLTETVMELRSEHGCPWDKRQTTTSLVKYLKSEFAELLAAIENNDSENLCEELGDLLFLIIMTSEINSETGTFNIGEVIEGVTQKLIRRHPHVFAGKTIMSEHELREQWERIKAEEKSKN